MGIGFSFGVPARRAVVAACLAVAALLGAIGLAPAVAEAQSKRLLLYTGTTGFRHTDAINNGRPVVQTALEAAGYTVDWEDCTNNGGGATNCDNAEQEPAHLHRREPRALRRDRPAELLRGTTGPALERRLEGLDHQVRPERRRHRGRPQRLGHGHHRRDVELVGRQQRQLRHRRHDGRPRRDQPRQRRPGPGRRPQPPRHARPAGQLRLR